MARGGYGGQMDDRRLTTFGGLGLLGVVTLVVESILALADQSLGTVGEVFVWVALALVALSAVILVVGLVQAPTDSPIVPDDSLPLDG
jgi:hypothetical protein